MNASRRFGLTLVLLLLSACEPAGPPTKPAKPVPAVPAVQPQAPSPKPAEPVKKSPPVIAKPAPEPKPAADASKPRPPSPVEQVELPKAKLDLRLPPELVEQLEPGEPAPGQSSEALLPPLFVEKSAPQSPFQLNGRLITNEREEDYWRSVEGAEVQFEFKR